MVYKLSDKAIITQENGKNVLIALDAQYSGTLSFTDSDGALSPNYFNDYFPVYTYGTNNGYIVGGSPASPYANIGNTIDKFPFANATTNASDVGDLAKNANGLMTTRSPSTAYASGGNYAGPTTLNDIQYFPFASDGNATDGGFSITQSRGAGAQSSSETHGYNAGGAKMPNIEYNIIDKIPFSSNASAADVGDLTVVKRGQASATDLTHGYTAGGGEFPAPTPSLQVIDRYPFSSDANATDVGDTIAGYLWGTGTQSSTHGYIASVGPPYTSSLIDKYTFGSTTTSSNVGTLTVGRSIAAGQSSETHGYNSGGQPGYSNVIDRWPFATDANATDVGDLSQARIDGSGTEN